MSRRTQLISTISLVIAVGIGTPACSSATQGHAAPQSPSATQKPAATQTSLAPQDTASTVNAANVAASIRTRVVTLRPVTAQGTAAPGYTVFDGPVEEVKDCRASTYSAEPGVYDCSPTSDNAIACVPATGGTLLCLSSIDHDALFRTRPVDGLPAAQASSNPLPLGVQLTSGARCSAYYNGTNPTAGRAFAVYGCTHGVGVFTTSYAHPFDTATALWTAQLHNADGTGTERTGQVRTAYFVGGTA